MSVSRLWHDGSESDWKEALSRYYNNPYDKNLEDRMEKLLPSDVERMSAQEFYKFLYEEYFVWKYTAKNRLVTTRKSLSKYESEGINSLAKIQKRIICLYREDPNNTEELLETTQRIYGLGIAGASGLLSILFPKYYGTLDQFIVRALLKVDRLPEHNTLEMIKPEKLTVKDGIVLENILRRKADELNQRFNTDEWTPRRLDMVLWAIDRY